MKYYYDTPASHAKDKFFEVFIFSLLCLGWLSFIGSSWKLFGLSLIVSFLIASGRALFIYIDVKQTYLESEIEELREQIYHSKI